MSEIHLPDSLVRVTQTSPKRLLIYSPPKLGKTTLLSKLDDCLIIDLENGSDYVEALKIQAKSYKELVDILIKIKTAGNPYKYIAIDTLTALEELALPEAARVYKSLPIGSTWTGKDVRTLPKGAGYFYLREAVLKILAMVEQCADRVIYVGHLKDKSIEKKGKEVSAQDVDLTGKLKSIVCSKMDSIAFLQREGKDVYANFQSSDEIVCGSRSNHLKGTKIILGTSDEKHEVTAYWNRIYID